MVTCVMLGLNRKWKIIMTDNFDFSTLLSQKTFTEYSGCRRAEVWQLDEVKLYHYQNDHKKTLPVLIVFALINRPTILDLSEKMSLIKKCLDLGMDIYLIDWGYPKKENTNIGLSDYVSKYIDGAVNYISKESNIKKINLMGICQGGVLSLCYASLFSKKLKSLVTMVTPVDFRTKEDRIYSLLKYVDMDLMVKALGNIPGKYITQFFLSLKPYELTCGKFSKLLTLTQNQQALTRYMLVEKWLMDNPDLVGLAAKEFITYFYQQNKFLTGDLIINHQVVKLENIQIPILNVIALRDHISPSKACKALRNFIDSTSYHEFEFDSGHIGLYVSEKSQNIIPQTLTNWLISLHF